jgi:hypothetical protein
MKAIKIHFGNVREGERFTTPDLKRLLTGVKIGLTFKDSRRRNAVILLDHTGRPAEDLGSLIFYQDHEYVEVNR